jgi:hypothetical protein
MEGHFFVTVSILRYLCTFVYLCTYLHIRPFDVYLEMSKVRVIYTTDEL